MNIDEKKFCEEIANGIIDKFKDEYKIFPFFTKCDYKSICEQDLKINEEDKEEKEARKISRQSWGEELIDSIQARFTMLINNFTNEEINDLFKSHIEKMTKRHKKNESK
jgi:hypothetical protein